MPELTVIEITAGEEARMRQSSADELALLPTEMLPRRPRAAAPGEDADRVTEGEDWGLIVAQS